MTGTDPGSEAARRRDFLRVAVPSVAIAAVLIVCFAWVSPGSAMWWTFIPAMVIALGLHLASTARRAPDPARVLPIYLVAFAWQFLHFAEEFTGGFWIRWPLDVFGAFPMDLTFFVWGNMASYAAFAMGALAIYRGWRIPLLIAWFFAIMGTIGDGIGHVVYAIVTADPLFPGTITGIGYLVIGPILVARMWRASRSPA